MVPDEPLLSPRRIAQAIVRWVWFIVVPEEPVVLPFWKHLYYHRRPAASDRDGFY